MQTEAITLIRKPIGALTPDMFEPVMQAVPELADGQVLLRVKLLSIDPYQRGLLDESPMTGAPVAVGAVMSGRGIGEVLQSRAPSWDVGDLALGEVGWREHSVVPVAGLQRIVKSPMPLSHNLGVLGFPAITAWLGLETIGFPTAGECVLVSSAAGAVGSAVGQIAKARGARVIGIAGGTRKLSLLRDTLGFDAAVDYRAERDLAAALKLVAPNGLDLYFDNVGEQMLDAAFSVLNNAGRVLLCGHIASYDDTFKADTGPRHYREIMNRRWRVQGFVVRDHMARFAEARKALVDLVESGRLQPVVTRIEGLRNAPVALCGLLNGHHVGKTFVELA